MLMEGLKRVRGEIENDGDEDTRVQLFMNTLEMVGGAMTFTMTVLRASPVAVPWIFDA
jgi:hypothetical protein